jgi:hypothetical protein
MKKSPLTLHFIRYLTRDHRYGCHMVANRQAGRGTAMPKARLAGAMVVAAGVAWSAGAQANLVNNPGFETGNFSGWTVGGTTTGTGGAINIGVDSFSYDVHSGTYGVFAGNDYTTTLDQTVSTIVGATYSFTYWLDVYQADATGGLFTAQWGGSGGTMVTSLASPPETDVFTQYGGSVVATATTTDLHFTFLNAPGWFGFDDVSVVETAGPPTHAPEPASLAVLAAGLAVLPWRRGARRR